MSIADKSIIRQLLEDRSWPELRNVLAHSPAPELADLLPDLDKSHRMFVFRLMPRSLANEVFCQLDPPLQASVIKDMTDEEARQALAGMAPDDRTQLLEELPGLAIQKMLNLLSPEDLREARMLLGYPEESVGRLMTPEYVAVRPNWTIAQAFQHIRARGSAGRELSTIYVTAPDWKLLDALELQKFVLAEPQQTVEQIMDRSFAALSPYDDREEAVEVMLKYDLLAAPVVNSEGVLLGVVTVDDVLDVAEEEATEDFQKIAAMAPLKTAYRDASVRSLYIKRIPWLIVLVFVYTLASGVITAYEETLAAQLALAAFLPLLMGSGGNVGAQSGTLMVRALATEDFDSATLVRALGKEVIIGLSLGTTMGMAAGLLGFVRSGVRLAVIVAVSMLAVVTIANLIGMVLPYLLSRSRADPAVASNPLITSITDITALMIYFVIATRLIALFGT